MALTSIEQPRIEAPQACAITPAQIASPPTLVPTSMEALLITPAASEPSASSGQHTAEDADCDADYASGQCLEAANPQSAEAPPEDINPAPLADEENAPEPRPSVAPPRVNRFTMLAACLALAAALGGMLGALGAFALARPQPTSVIAAAKFPSEEIQALKENVVQARVELAALKVSIDAGNRGATTQFTKLAERIERMERNAAEPAAKLNKAVENFERIARAENAAALKDVTGSIAPAQPAASKSGGLEGWVLREVHRGTAFLEGRGGVVEVEQGDLVPGLGRIDAIRKQDGRWVVVTSKGTLTASPR
jgi:hypothetical protein